MAALAALLVVGGCAVQEREPSTSSLPAPAVTAAPTEPETLAFADDEADGAVPAQAPQADAGSAAAFTVVTDTATVGIHSAPDHVYTRLGTLQPGANVLATGRTVDVDGIGWMEIHWRDTLGWVVSAAFAPLGD